MPAPTTEERFTRGRMVLHRILPAREQAGVGRVMGVVHGFYNQGTWVVVQWPGGHVGCSRPGNLELLIEGDETP